jgi:putative Mn2+ efflux pump MntP
MIVLKIIGGILLCFLGFFLIFSFIKNRKIKRTFSGMMYKSVVFRVYLTGIVLVLTGFGLILSVLFEIK